MTLRILISATLLLLYPASALALTLESALAHVYTHNPQLQSQRRQLAALDEQIAQAVSEWRPSLAVDYSTGRQRLNYNNGVDMYSDTSTQRLMLTQPLFNGGGSIARYHAAHARILAGQAELEATTQRILVEAILAYMNVLRDQEILRLSAENVAALNEQKLAADQRFAVEEVTKTDIAQSKARLARATADKISAANRYQESRAAFVRLMNRPPDNLDALPPLPALPPSLEEALALSKVHSPDMAQARQSVQARSHEVSAEKSGLLPSISLQGAMVREESGATSFGTTDYDNDSLMLNVSIPLYQSGAEYSRIRAARQNRASAHHDAVDMQQQVTARITQLWHALQSYRALVDSYTVAAETAQDAIDGVELEQLHGMRTVLDVLDAKQEFFAAQTGLVRARFDAQATAYSLLQATGMLTPALLHLPVKEYDPAENLHRVKLRPIGY